MIRVVSCRITAARVRAIVVPAVVATALACAPQGTNATAGRQAPAVPDEWTAYGHDAGGTRYSPLTQVTRDNVASLKEAWRYRTGDLVPARFEDTPLFADGSLFIATPLGRVIALDPVTGKERWTFDPHVDLSGDYGDFATRGVSTWVDSTRAAGAPCRRRIFIATIDSRLIALDAKTGAVCAGFGTRGEVALLDGVRNQPRYTGEFEVTSPPAIVNGLVIVGNAISDNQRTDAPAGVVRAYDARTGALRWSWDPVPQSPDARGYDTWKGPKAHATGAANAWSIISVDPARGLVFVPTGSASPDFYGGERLGANQYANSIVALRASTGEMAWSFQVVHHDLWDYDVPAQPVLFTLSRDGGTVPAVAVATKMGHLFLFNRETGDPLFPVEEHPVPRSTVLGEEASPTQPFPVKPAPIGRRSLTPDSAWGPTAADRDACRGWVRKLRYQGIFTPPSTQGTLILPGNIGGATWTGLAVDTARGLLVVPTNTLPFSVTLVPRGDLERARARSPGAEMGRQEGTPYVMMRRAILGPSGAPCTPPPWSLVTAIDLATGDVKWQRPFGFIPRLTQADSGAERWGSIGLGGVMLTAGGVVFAAGTLDEHLWAYDVETGRELARFRLPAGGNASPMTYQGADGRQYVVIAAGGHDRLNTTLGDYVIAYALGGGASAPNEVLFSLAPDWTGELREPARLRTAWQLRARGDSVSGTMRVDDPAVTGTVTGVRHGNAIALRIAFDYPGKKCSGVLAGDGSLANGGALLEGVLSETGTCTDRQGSKLSVLLRTAGAR